MILLANTSLHNISKMLRNLKTIEFDSSYLYLFFKTKSYTVSTTLNRKRTITPSKVNQSYLHIAAISPHPRKKASAPDGHLNFLVFRFVRDNSPFIHSFIGVVNPYTHKSRPRCTAINSKCTIADKKRLPFLVSIFHFDFF